MSVELSTESMHLLTAMKNKKLEQLAFQTSLLYAEDFPGEPFHRDYKRFPEVFRLLIRSDRKLEKKMAGYFKDFAKRLRSDLVDWRAYNKKVKAADIDDWIQVDWDEERLQIKVNLTDALQDAILAGGKLMELESSVDVGWKANTSEVVDFLNKYSLNMARGLSNTTRDRLRSALALSVSNGEKVADAKNRILDVIDDPKRAATIARTESVRAFGAGRKAVAVEIGFDQKEWHTTIQPCPICQPLPSVGKIGIDEYFDAAAGIKEEPAHPNCRCSVRYSKGEEK